jgi:high-affinity iron transporter
MPAVALLVFREVLEAALIISVVCAATRGVPRRGSFVLAGIGLGVVGALLVAVGADYIAALAGGAGQDIFNAGVLLSAVVMIGWHVVWMSSHGRELAEHMRSVGGAVKAGSRSLTLLLTVVALAVLREGSEIVLFLYGMAAGGIGRGGLATGIALGIGAGATMGFALYFGLLRIPIQHFFSVTNAMLILLAAGLASTAAGFLVQSDLLPSWGSQIWNTSHLLSDDSLPGKTLGILIGYKAAPSGIQIVFYLVTAALLVAGLRWQHRRSPALAAPVSPIPREGGHPREGSREALP